MYSYEWDVETGGYLLNSSPAIFSKEPRPVYYKELDILGFDQHWNYDKDDSYPFMWAEANNYYYRGRLVAKAKGGSLYTAPELILIEDPEPQGEKLKFVNIQVMVAKNKSIMESLVQNTIKKIYNTYVEYRDKINVFYVAFSGGKDSVTVLDLVQRALPHNCFKVIFGDTDMEFPTTLRLADAIGQFCTESGIEYLVAKSHIPSKVSWSIFGPPARKLRWCCSVHKSVPVINRLCESAQLKKIRAMMITGVRSDESASRSEYDELSIGKKISGQYSFHPILEWSSAEVFLYVFANDLLLNEAYKYGFSRVGCIMCPNSSERHEYIKRMAFPEIVDDFCDRIVATSKKELSGDNRAHFLETGGWKMRISGRELAVQDERFTYQETAKYFVFTLNEYNDKWKEWYKALGTLVQTDDQSYRLEYNSVWRVLHINKNGSVTIFEIENDGKNKNSIEFISLFKAVIVKSLYCINCKLCVAECVHRNIEMDEHNLHISEKCSKCHACLKVIKGCIYFNSIRDSKGVKKMTGLNRYLSVGVSGEWIHNYFSDTSYEPGNRKTDVMFTFLSDCGILQKRKFADFGNMIKKVGISTDNAWALMLCNLSYTSAFGWYVKNIPFNEIYIEERLKADIGEDVADKAKGEFWNGFKTILDTTPYGATIGLGTPDITRKLQKNGDEKKKLNSILRTSWQNPNPLVILYALYKFAEACGDYYQFTLSRLLNHDIDSDGVSPTEIFGLDRETMERILNGLTVNYPEFISASFTLDLDNITLRNDKTSVDVLTLF